MPPANAFYFCAPLGIPGNDATYSEAMANAAANRWSTNLPTTTTCTGGFCVVRRTATDSAMWCYQGVSAGYGSLRAGPVFLCPTLGVSDPNTFIWR